MSDDTPVVDEQPPVEEPIAAEPEIDESSLEPDDTAQAIDVPDGGRLVPIGVVAKARATVKELKTELAGLKPTAERAQQLEAQLAQEQAKVQAYEALIQQHSAAQTKEPPKAAEETPEERAELEELARTLVLVKPDGDRQVLDLDAARNHMKFINRVAERRAKALVEAEVGPMRQQGVQSQSAYMLERAKATVIDGQQVDPHILTQVWAAIDPSVTATEQGAKAAFLLARGMPVKTTTQAAATTTTQRNANGQFQKQEPPMFTERAGGRATADAPKLDAADQRLAKELGLSEKEYAAAYTSRRR